jgi:hypothetical protein
VQELPDVYSAGSLRAGKKPDRGGRMVQAVYKKIVQGDSGHGQRNRARFQTVAVRSRSPFQISFADAGTRAAAKVFAKVVLDNTPASIRLLRECVMTANASIALGGLPIAIDPSVPPDADGAVIAKIFRLAVPA